MINNENKKSYAFKPKTSKIKTKNNDSEINKDIMKEKGENNIKNIPYKENKKDKEKKKKKKINNKEYKTEEIKKFKMSLMLNKCNCYNNLKDYPSTVKLGKEIIGLDEKTLKAYYYLGTALAYLDEFEEAMTNYNKLYELIPDKKDPGVIGLLDLINKRKQEKENNMRKKFKAFLSHKD